MFRAPGEVRNLFALRLTELVSVFVVPHCEYPPPHLSPSPLVLRVRRMYGVGDEGISRGLKPASL
jgi:hypothetical protein